MNWRACFLLAVSILGAASLSCHGPTTGALNPKIAAEVDTSSPTQGPRGTETPKSEIKVPESDRDRESRIEKMRHDQEIIMLVGLIGSFM